MVKICSKREEEALTEPCTLYMQSLTSASPTINMKEALQVVQGMYNATLDCDKINAWTQEDTEMTGLFLEEIIWLACGN